LSSYGDSLDVAILYLTVIIFKIWEVKMKKLILKYGEILLAVYVFLGILGSIFYRI